MNPTTEKSPPVSQASLPASNSPFGHGPRSWMDYLAYPRVLFTLILCGLFFVLHIAYGIYALFFEK